MKISDKLAQRKKGEISFSFEYFCPKTEQGIFNLIDRIDLMAKLKPLFVDITWNAGGCTSSDTTLELVQVTQNEIGADTCMHMTCTNMTVEQVDNALQSAYDAGCRNILALRGDPPLNRDEDSSDSTSEFKYAKDLVSHIRKKFGDDVSIGVAGYPEGHPEQSDPAVLIRHLKEKVDAGADFIVTQMFYDAEAFIKWAEDVRSAGISVPLVPGIMPVSGWASFLRRAKWCQINLPKHWLEALEPISHDDAAVRSKGTELIAEMCQDIVARTDVDHLHFYTMNLEKSPVMCLDALDLVRDSAVASEEDDEAVVPVTHQKSRLRRESTLRSVRPIHWRNRPQSYSSRTANWDEFPNGRWGDIRSPAFNDLNELEALLKVSSAAARKWWGHPESGKDVAKIVRDYLNGELSSLPWSDAPAASEIEVVRPQLNHVNDGSKEWFSINSQPAVNGKSSTDPTFGWGPPNGFVYQKAYVELMVDPQVWESDLLPKLQALPHDEATYYAVKAGCNDKLVTNAYEDEVNAVTWGIFPGREVAQPTIVEGASFLAWKCEAFKIAEEWAKCYPKDSKSHQFLTEMSKTWILVNIVHHDFTQSGKIYEILTN